VERHTLLNVPSPGNYILIKTERIMKKQGFLLLMILFVTAGASGGSCYAKNPDNMVITAYVSAQGKRLTALYDIASEKVTLGLPDGKTLTLPAARSASGSRYSDGKMIFWEHQGTATLYRGEVVLFEGKDPRTASMDRTGKGKPSMSTVTSSEDSELLRKAIAQYASYLRKTDKEFGNHGPTGRFNCQINAGSWIPPVGAYCTNTVGRIKTKNDWASVIFVITPEEINYKDLPILADGTLYFLMKKEKSGSWQGVHWFLGSSKPSLGRKKMKGVGISSQLLASLGWMVGAE
jgi:membrane-bound inhibitor of C-type lysozyme